MENGLINNDSIVVSGSEDANLVCWDLIQVSKSSKSTQQFTNFFNFSFLFQGKIIEKVHHDNHRVIHSIDCHPTKNEIITAGEGNVHLWEFNQQSSD